MMTSRALAAIAVNSGVRCCKRSTYAAIESALQYFKEVLGVELEHIPVSRLKCEHSHRNKQCSYADCRYFAGKYDFKIYMISKGSHEPFLYLISRKGDLFTLRIHWFYDYMNELCFAPQGFS